MSLRLYHISEESDIGVFDPRPSPSEYEQIRGDVVFAVSGELLHNYLLPRNCPRVTYYAGPQTTEQDRKAFLSGGSPFVVAVESSWRQSIRDSILYCYEFPISDFELLDENAGYYISYEAVRPLSVTTIRNPLTALAERGVQVVYIPALWPLAEEILGSSMCFSLIRMSEAGQK